MTTSSAINKAELKIIEVATMAANGRCEVAIHAGDKGHRAVRITGCFTDDARDIANDIAAALTKIIRKDGYPVVRTDAGWCAVWYR